MGVDRIEINGADNLPALLKELAKLMGPDRAELILNENVKIALNQELIEGPCALADGDEVAFLPPVTGG